MYFQVSLSFFRILFDTRDLIGLVCLRTKSLCRVTYSFFKPRCRNNDFLVSYGGEPCSTRLYYVKVNSDLFQHFYGVTETDFSPLFVVPKIHQSMVESDVE